MSSVVTTTKVDPQGVVTQRKSSASVSRVTSDDRERVLVHTLTVNERRVSTFLLGVTVLSLGIYFPLRAAEAHVDSFNPSDLILSVPLMIAGGSALALALMKAWFTYQLWAKEDYSVSLWAMGAAALGVAGFGLLEFHDEASAESNALPIIYASMLGLGVVGLGVALGMHDAAMSMAFGPGRLPSKRDAAKLLSQDEI
jgi:tellurite resistance protein TehA-like permease